MIEKTTLKRGSEALDHSQSYQIGYFLFLFALIAYPYLFILNIFLPSTLSFGKNTYIFLMTVIIILSFAFQAKKILTKLRIESFLVVTVLSVFAFCMRVYLYGESIGNIFIYRMLLLPMIYVGVAHYYLTCASRKKTVYAIIIGNCVIQASLGVIHTYFFPQIYLNYNQTEPVLIGTVGAMRESGLLMSSSLFANFVLLGFILLIYTGKYVKIKKIIEYAFAVLMLWAVALSASRLPFIFSIVFFLIYFKKKIFSKKAFMLFIVLAVFFMLLPNIFLYDVNKVITHTNLDRLVKYQAGLAALYGDFRSFLFGPLPGSMIASSDELTFSDNSFLTLMITFGVPISFLCILLFIHLVKKTGVRPFKKNYAIFFYFAVTLLLTNSVIWDIWLFYFFVVFYCIQETCRCLDCADATKGKFIYER